MFTIFVFYLMTLSPILAEPYKRLTYQSGIDKLKLLAKENSDIIHYENLADRYSYLLKPLKCGDKKCEYPLLRISNYLASKEEINKRPQTLLLAGIHGNEIIS